LVGSNEQRATIRVTFLNSIRGVGAIFRPSFVLARSCGSLRITYSALRPKGASRGALGRKIAPVERIVFMLTGLNYVG